MYPKVFIGPMSTNIIRAVRELSSDFPIGLIPSRRQVDIQGGYVDGLDIAALRHYIKDRVIIERDHGGPGQGTSEDDGTVSLSADCSDCDIIHIDPWKAFQDYGEGMKKLIELIHFCHDINPDVEFEVGTEEAIRPFTRPEYNSMLQWLKDGLPKKVWQKITYVVVQSGTHLDLPNQKNTGVFNAERLKSQLTLIKDRGKLAKEHNGDYLSAEEIQMRFKMGVDAINIAPEIGQYESESILDVDDPDFTKHFYQKCLENIGMFQKWFAPDFNPFKEPTKMILTGGHYVLSQLENPPDVYDLVKDRLKKRLEDIYAE